MQERFIVSLQMFTPPRRSEMGHVRYFAAFPVFFIYSYGGKFSFKTVNTTSLQALHFYEGEMRQANVTPVHEFASYRFASLLYRELFDSY